MIKKWCNSWPWGIIGVILRLITKDNHNGHFLFLTPYLENKQSLHLTGNSSVAYLWAVSYSRNIRSTRCPRELPLSSPSQPHLAFSPLQHGAEIGFICSPWCSFFPCSFSLALSLVCLCTWVSPAPYGSWEQGEQWSGSEQKGCGVERPLNAWPQSGAEDQRLADIAVCVVGERGSSLGLRLKFFLSVCPFPLFFPAFYFFAVCFLILYPNHVCLLMTKSECVAE